MSRVSWAIRRRFHQTVLAFMCSRSASFTTITRISCAIAGTSTEILGLALGLTGEVKFRKLGNAFHQLTVSPDQPTGTTIVIATIRQMTSTASTKSTITTPYQQPILHHNRATSKQARQQQEECYSMVTFGSTTSQKLSAPLQISVKMQQRRMTAICTPDSQMSPHQWQQMSDLKVHYPMAGV